MPKGGKKATKKSAPKENVDQNMTFTLTESKQIKDFKAQSKKHQDKIYEKE